MCKGWLCIKARVVNEEQNGDPQIDNVYALSSFDAVPRARTPWVLKKPTW
jgi:hypothetical protein